MLTRLDLENVGPGPNLTLDLARRLNLLTGDNGLGKTFLLDVAWWALTRRWPQEVNRRLTSGLRARPREPREPARIRFDLTGKSKPVRWEAEYRPRDEAWLGKAGRPANPGLVLYAHADGAFSIWDPARNYWRKKGDIDIPERLPAHVFTEFELWNGLRADIEGEARPVCNGLLYDWASWIRGQDENAAAMATALRVLSPAADPRGALKPGPLLRLSVNDARDIPSLVTAHAGAVPILHASAGVRRVTQLAYALVWSWSEHQIAATQLGEEPTRQVVLLFDEVESHLHPRWQRLMLRALRDLVATLYGQAQVQLLVSTHAPLVLASAEPRFDPECDAWFDLDLDGEPPRLQVRRCTFTPLGTADRWLTSEAFDLPTERGSLEAEQGRGGRQPRRARIPA